MLVVGGLAILISWLDARGSVGAWWGDQPRVTLTVGIPAAIALIAAAACFPAVRHVLP